jgi:hypothetical protein
MTYSANQHMNLAHLNSLYESRHESQEAWTTWTVAMQEAWPEMYRGMSMNRDEVERLIGDMNHWLNAEDRFTHATMRARIEDLSYECVTALRALTAAPQSAAPPESAAMELLRRARKWMNKAVGDSWVAHDAVNPDLFNAIDALLASSPPKEQIPAEHLSAYRQWLALGMPGQPTEQKEGKS